MADEGGGEGEGQDGAEALSGVEALRQDMEPTKLHHGLSGWPPQGPNAFRWESGRLVYMFARSGVHRSKWDEAVTPSISQWEGLWRVCDEIDVWSWPATQGDMRVRDGLQWITELEFDGRSVASRGQVQRFSPRVQREAYAPASDLTGNGWMARSRRKD